MSPLPICNLNPNFVMCIGSLVTVWQTFPTIPWLLCIPRSAKIQPFILMSIEPVDLNQGCTLRFWKGKGTKAISLCQRAPYEEIVKFYWSISRAPRQWQGATEAIASVASVKYQACHFQIWKFVRHFWRAPRPRTGAMTFVPHPSHHALIENL